MKELMKDFVVVFLLRILCIVLILSLIVHSSDLPNYFFLSDELFLCWQLMFFWIFHKMQDEFSSGIIEYIVFFLTVFGSLILHEADTSYLTLFLSLDNKIKLGLILLLFILINLSVILEVYISHHPKKSFYKITAALKGEPAPIKYTTSYGTEFDGGYYTYKDMNGKLQKINRDGVHIDRSILRKKRISQIRKFINRMECKPIKQNHNDHGSIYFVDVVRIGDLYLDRVLIKEGTPILFTLTDGQDQLYLCLNLKTHETQKWILNMITEDQLIDLIENKSSILEAFKNDAAARKSVLSYPQDRTLIEWDTSAMQLSSTATPFSKFNPVDLPDADLKLDLDPAERESLRNHYFKRKNKKSKFHYLDEGSK